MSTTSPNRRTSWIRINGPTLCLLYLSIMDILSCGATTISAAHELDPAGHSKGGESATARREYRASLSAHTEILAPLELVTMAGQDVELEENGACLPERFFASHGGGSARRVQYHTALGRTQALVSCREQGLVRLEIYPWEQPDTRYLVFFSEPGVALEQRSGQPEGWTRLCDGSGCLGDLDAATVESWRADLSDSARLAQVVRELHATWDLPDRPGRAAPASPLFGAGQAPYSVVFARAGEIWHIRPDGSQAHATGIPAGADSTVIRVGGRFSHGLETPALSPDRRNLAYLQDGNLFLADLDRAEPTEVLRSREGREAIVINSWTPDGAGLLAYVEDTRSHEGTYRQVDSRTFEVDELSLEERAVAWTADSSAVLFDRAGSRGITLYRQSIHGGEPTVLATSRESSAFRPLTASLGILSYLEDNDLCILPEDGGTRQVIARSTGSAEIIRPVISPDSRHVAFFWDSPDSDGLHHLAVANLESREIRRVTPCTSRCEFQWYDDQHLMFTDGQQRLYLVNLDGREMPLGDRARLVGIGRPLQP